MSNKNSQDVDDIAVEATEQVQSQEEKSTLSPLDTLAAAVEHVRRSSDPQWVPTTLEVRTADGRVKQRLEAYGAACRNSPQSIDLVEAQARRRPNSPDPDAIMENIREQVAKDREEAEARAALVSGDT